MSLQAIKYVVAQGVSKSELVVCFKVLYEGQQTKIKGSRKFTNTPKGHADLKNWIEKRRKDESIPVLVVMEATGVYHEQSAYYFHEQGYQVSVVLPSQSANYFKSLGNKSKTDKIDAQGLAQMGAERTLRLWQPPSKEVRNIRHLNRHKNALGKTKTQLRNRLHAHHHSAQSNNVIINQLKEHIAYIDDQITQVVAAIEQALATESEFGKKVHKIADSISGIGAASVAAIAAETDGFALFTSVAQLTSFAGYDVVQNQSGLHRGKTKISKKGNPHIRKTMFFPALNVVRMEVDTFVNLYERVFDRTKIKMKGYVAVQRKLLCILYTLWKKNEAFDANYHNELAHKEKAALKEPAVASATLD
ncbi:MAG: IS110 family transposase [Bacteroidota bacterium]